MTPQFFILFLRNCHAQRFLNHHEAAHLDNGSVQTRLSLAILSDSPNSQSADQTPVVLALGDTLVRQLDAKFQASSLDLGQLHQLRVPSLLLGTLFLLSLLISLLPPITFFLILIRSQLHLLHQPDKTLELSAGQLVLWVSPVVLQLRSDEKHQYVLSLH